MRVAVELTYDDFSEASAAVRAVLVEKKQRKMRASPLLVAGPIVGGVLVYVLLSMGFPFGSDPYASIRPPLYWGVTIAMPFVVIGLLIVPLAVLHQGARLKQLFGLLLPIVGLVALLVLLHLLTGRSDGARGRADARDWFGTLVPHLPWVVIAAVCATVVTRALRDQTRVAWDAYAPHLRRKVYDITAEGVSVDEGVSRAQYAWAAFARFQETPNLLLLCPTDLTFEVLPKRAFATPEDRNAARHLFATQIHDAASTATQAFPVVAPSAPATPTPASSPQPAAPVPPPLPAQQA